MDKEKLGSILGIIFIIILFILISYIVENNINFIKNFIGKGISGMVLYVFVLVFATLFAPISDLPLMPIASAAWGWFSAALLSIIGWTLGAAAAFFIARKYGTPLVSRFFSLKKIEKYSRFVPEHHIFWSIVLLRIAVPVDILSYVLGLFSRINITTYLLATLIGVAPFAFIFAYLGKLPLYLQIIVFSTLASIALFAFICWKYRQRLVHKN